MSGPPAGDAVLLMLCNAPDAGVAERIAQELVARGLAACVNVGAPVLSIYRWQGAVERAEEVPLFIKTVQARREAVQDAIAGLHPYDVPEIVALPITHGLPAYLEWVRQETQC